MLVFVADGTGIGVDAGIGVESVVAVGLDDGSMVAGAVTTGADVAVDVGEEVGGEDTVGVAGTGVGTCEGI